MKIKFHPNNIIEITDDSIIINEIDDALSLLFAHNCSGIIVKKENVTPDFFDLSTGLAGEILQKCSNYNVKIAIVGDYTNITSKPLNDFIRESNSRRQILFVPATEAALRIFGG
ncbi:MAG: DUF4180 domain-containing protein [Tannerellaceae bacterium]|jgi:hypothetical protein|nr:DUF4180 domain-containing protein [Tannerellaceae bacterium]